MGQDGGAGVVARTHRLDPVPGSARVARDAVVHALSLAGRDDLAETATLLVSELVTNAIVHARTQIALQVVAGAAGLRVAVGDGSPTLPSQRHYGRSATTGRGLALVDLMSDRHGTDTDASQGKTVWFELGVVSPAPAQQPPTKPHDAPRKPAAPAPTETDDVTVRLAGVPVALALAWQQHADTLLREYVLSRWDDENPTPPADADPGAAHDAFATLAASLEELAAAEHLPAYADVTVLVPPARAAQFAELDALLDHVLDLAEHGQTLAPPTQPEIRSFRRWVVEQVRGQAGGRAPEPWPGLPDQLEPAALPPVTWDTSAVEQAAGAVVAADDVNRIIAASPAALELLGWDGDLLGRRIVTIIPARFRESHIAAFTLNLLGGEGRIIGREVSVPARRRDGSEVEVVLVVERETAAEGRAVFTATMRRP